MPRGGWLTYLRPQAGSEIPASFRLTVGAISGAALSLSYTGLYLSIYSWVCVGILLFSLFGTRPRVAFGCGFLHGLLFVLTSLPWIATVLAVHGGLSIVGGWSLLLLIAIAWGTLTGAFAWSVHRLSRQSVELACMGAPFLWVALEFAWLSGSRKSGLSPGYDHHGGLRAILSCGGFQFAAHMDGRVEYVDGPPTNQMCSRCNCNSLERRIGWAAPAATATSSSLRACRAA